MTSTNASPMASVYKLIWAVKTTPLSFRIATRNISLVALPVLPLRLLGSGVWLSVRSSLRRNEGMAIGTC